MVAQHRVDAIFRLQLLQHVDVGIKLRRLYVLQITHKQDDIRFLGIDTVNGSLQQPTVMLLITAHVGIREEHDAIAVEGFGHFLRYVCLVVYLQLVESHERSPEQHKPHRWY